MNSLRQAIFLALNRRFYYGWVIVAVAGLGMFASGAGQSHTFSVFVGPIAADLEIPSTLVASAYGLATLVAAFALPSMGRLVDRHGARRVSLFVVVLLGLACAALGAAVNVVWLAIGFAALRFLGQGSMMLNCSNLVSQWFSRRRGFALSLMVLGFAVSMAVHPPLGQALVELVGWRWAWVALGLITWALMVPVLLLLAHNKPEDLGLVPDGPSKRQPHPGERQTPPAGTRASGTTTAAEALAGLTLRQALGTGAFYIVAAGMFSISMLLTALHFYQVSIFQAQGLDAGLAARIFPISALTMVLAMPLVGRLADHRPTRQVFAASLVLVSLSLAAASLVDGLPSALVYAVVFGISNAASLTLFGYLWPRYFGRRHLGSIQGTGQMISVVGASLGPLPLGIAFDLLASYTATLRLLALLPLACATAALFLRTPAGVPVDGRLE
jgi:MFS family permease